MVQRLVQSSQPLARSMDYLAEDLDNMAREYRCGRQRGQQLPHTAVTAALNGRQRKLCMAFTVVWTIPLCTVHTVHTVYAAI